MLVVDWLPLVSVAVMVTATLAPASGIPAGKGNGPSVAERLDPPPIAVEPEEEPTCQDMVTDPMPEASLTVTDTVLVVCDAHCPPAEPDCSQMSAGEADAEPSEGGVVSGAAVVVVAGGRVVVGGGRVVVVGGGRVVVVAGGRVVAVVTAGRVVAVVAGGAVVA
nr:hypothetical protein [Acidimicrobiia bacterium]